MEISSLFEIWGLPNEKTVLIWTILIVGIPILVLRIYCIVQAGILKREIDERYSHLSSQLEKEEKIDYSEMSKRLSEEEVDAILESIPPYPLTLEKMEKIWLTEIFRFLENCEKPYSIIPEPRGNPIWDSLRGQISKKYSKVGLDENLLSFLPKEKL